MTVTNEDAVVRLRDGAAFCVLVFLGARVLLSLTAVLTVGSVPVPPSATSGIEVPATPGWHNAFDGMQRWDAYWFERIARDGYREGQADGAFFPAYPIVIRAMSSVTTMAEAGSALLVSNLAFVGALVVLYGLSAREYSIAIARRTVVLLAFFPASFFFLAPYSESLFLLLTVLAFWWIRRSRWGAGSLAAFVAALARSIGILLMPALLIEAWRGPREHRTLHVAAAAAPLLALLLYAGYWLARSGDALWPLHSQAAWYRSVTFPLWTIARGVLLGIGGLVDTAGIYRTADLLLTAILLVPLAFRWRTIPITYLVYAVSSAIVFLSYPSPDRPFLSDPRFLIVVFPAFWALADMLSGRRYVITVVCFVAAYVAMAVAFMNWAFVF
jgi:hypothetical protein